MGERPKTCTWVSLAHIRQPLCLLFLPSWGRLNARVILVRTEVTHQAFHRAQTRVFAVAIGQLAQAVDRFAGGVRDLWPSSRAADLQVCTQAFKNRLVFHACILIRFPGYTQARIWDVHFGTL